MAYQIFSFFSSSLLCRLSYSHLLDLFFLLLFPFDFNFNDFNFLKVLFRDGGSSLLGLRHFFSLSLQYFPTLDSLDHLGFS